MIMVPIRVVLGFLVLGQTTVIIRPEREHQGLAGAVKSILEETAILSNRAGNWIEGRKTKAYVVHFDPQGNLKKVSDYTHQPVFAEISFSYDGSGNRSETIEWDDRSFGTRRVELVKRVFRLNSHGYRLEENVHRRVPGSTSQLPILIESCA